MNQTTDSHIYNLGSTISLLREKSAEYPAATSRNYLKAISAFEAFTSLYPTEDAVFSPTMLADWYVAMVITGRTRKTALQYINSLSALCSALPSEENGLPTGFTYIKEKIRKLSDDMPDCSIDADNFARLLQLIRTADRLPDNLRLAAVIMVVLLINPTLTLSDISRFEKGSIDRIGSKIGELAEPYISPRRKYLFPLGQSEKTPKQVVDALESEILGLLRSRHIATFGSAESTLRSYWAYAAIMSGATPCDTVSTLGHTPSGLAALAVCPRNGSTAALPNVESLLLSNPRQWHAMRLRPGVRFASLTERLDTLPGASPELFYPCVEIARRIGKKLIYSNRPLITDIVFFRSRMTEIPALFRHIGDLAWCYRESNADGSPYATIPDASMLEFQTAIGLFTADMDLYPIGAIDLQPNDIVEVVGDMFMGRQGRVEGTVPGQPTIYRLIIWGDNGLEWRADVDSRLIKKIASPQLTVV